MVIGGYYNGDYWLFFLLGLLVATNGYFIGGYWWLL